MNIWKSTGLLMASGLLSRVLGLVRDRIFTQYFGVDRTLDIYLSAFKVPDFIFGIFIAGVLSSVFIPIYLKKQDQDRHNFATTCLVGFGMCMGVAATSVYVFAPYLARLVSPGFTSDELLLLSQLIRVMSISIFVFTLSNIFSSILNAIEKYWAYALAPILYNIGIIVGFYLFVPQFGVLGLAWGVVLGACAHLLIQLPSVFRSGWHTSALFVTKDFVELIQKMIPRFLSGITSQINIFALNYFLSFATIGSITLFYLANNIYYVIIGIFIIAISTTTFPSLVRSITTGTLGITTTNALLATLFFTIPSTIVYIISGSDIAHILYGGGPHLSETGTILTCLSLSLVFQGGVYILARVFYALEDTLRPFIINLIALLVLIGLSMNSSWVHNAQHIATIYSLSIMIQCLAYILVLIYRYKLVFVWRDLAKNAIILAFSTACATMLWYGVTSLSVWEYKTAIEQVIIHIGAWVPAGFVYVYISKSMGVAHAQTIWNKVSLKRQ